MTRTLLQKVLLAALLVVASALAPAAQAQRRDTVTLAMAQEPDILGPMGVMAAAGVIHNIVFGDITPFNEKWQRIPLMVEKFPTLKDGDWVVLPNKKMRVTWKLKRGFTWHDGRPVTALDWRFTYGMMRNPQVPSIARFVLNKVDNILVPDVNDPYTMVVQWNELWPFAGSQPFGQNYVLPRHVLERPYLANPAQLKAHPFWRLPVGAGPYKMTEWVAGSHMSFEAHEKWPLGAPAIKKVTLRFILDSTVLQANVISGSVDATDINNFSCLQMEQIAQRNPRVEAHYREAMVWERIDFNNDDVWLKDKRVRQAIGYALDRKAIAEVSCSGGRQPVAHSWMAPGHPAANPNVKKYEYDPVKARALLAEAGFRSGPDGILRDSAGRRVEMSLSTTSGNSIREQIEQIVKEQLRQVGIDVRIDNRPASVFFGAWVTRRQFPHMAMYASLFTPESVPSDRFHSNDIPSAANAWSGNNRVGWRNAENDRLWEQIIAELDAEKRNALLKKQQEIFAEDLPSLPLYFRLDLTTYPKAMRNVKPVGLGSYYIPWNIWEWRWGDQ
ncbi:MAG: peptide ABC transporter substrate-binding protein [Armatimonadota bacterium]|nr:peptide ABC transporter substrate-binding protein [Armatimonadota bacterium]